MENQPLQNPVQYVKASLPEQTLNTLNTPQPQDKRLYVGSGEDVVYCRVKNTFEYVMEYEDA